MSFPQPPKGEQCTARSKQSQQRCKRLVVGGGVCVMHGGAAPQVKAARLQRVAIAQAARFNGPVPVSGSQALLDELARTNGQVRALEDTLGLEQYLPSQEHSLVQRFMAERGHLKQVAEAVVRLDVDGRLEHIAQQQGAQFVETVREITLAFGLNPADEDVRAVILAAIGRVVARHEGALDTARRAVRS